MWTETPEQDDSLQMSNESNSTISLSQIPNDNDLNNARLIKLTLKSSEHLVDALMLFHDELSTIVSTRNKSMTYGLNYKFVKWLYDQILNTFQDSFIVTECPKGGEEDIPMDYFFSINSANDSSAYEELNTDALDIGINIAGIVLGSSATKTQLQLMCPMFHSLSSLTYRRYSTSLDTISALLGCSLVLPKNFLDEEKLFEDLETVAIDLYFHVANWLRCVISAFVSQNARCMKKKVLKRINQLIDIEASVKFLLQKVDLSYEAPPITFQMKEDFNFIKPAVPKRKGDTDSEEEEEPTDGNEPNFNEIDFEEPGPSKKKAKKSKKKKKKQKIDDEITEFDEESMNINLNETLGNLPVKTQIATQGTQSAEIVKHRAKYWFSYGKQEKYRQLDIDLMILLEEPLEIAYDLPETEVGNNLTLQELKFVVADLISKTESLAGVKKFRVDQQTQQIVCVHAFMYDLVSSVKHLVRFKNKLGDFIYEKIREMEADESIPRLCELLSHAKICFGAIFHLFGAIFSWPNFIIDDHQKMLRTAMTEILEMPPQEVDSLEMEEIEIEDLAEKTLEKIVADEPRVMDLRSSVHLLHCVKAVSRYANNPEAIVNLAEVLLKRQWIALDGTKEFSKNSDLFLTELLKCFMREMELPKLEDVINGAAAEMIALKTKTDWMTLYPNFNRSNCTIFYRVVAITCESSMKHCIATVARTADLIECWMRCFHVLQALLTINEENPILTNTSTFLKYSHSIMKVFRGNGVKTMEKMADRDPHAVQDLLKAMQKTTRFLHSITVDTKAKISSRVLTQVPKIRETMEKLVLEVKAALATNHSLSGFWVSNLHNKNGTGDVLLSQIQNAPQEEREADEEPEIEDDLNSPENSDVDEEGEASSTPSMASSVVSRPSKIFD